MVDHGKHPALFIGMLLSVLGIAMLAMAAFQRTLPDRSQLKEATGRLGSIWNVTERRHGKLSEVRFTLDSDLRYFSYPDHAGDIYEVRAALQRSGRVEKIRILFDPSQATSPLLDEASRAFHTAFEIDVGGKLVRSYSEVRASWRSYRSHFLWFGVALLVPGAGLLGWFFRKASS